MNISFKITGDGSHTLENKELDETYHSRHGAIQEAYHVFIKSGLELLSEKKELSIFEMGFGTGLNAFITLLESFKSSQDLTYYSLESYPLSQDVWQNLNYITELQAEDQKHIFQKLHEVSWEQDEKISPTFTLHKMEGELEKFEPDFQVDLIYFDAFGPRVQPQLWTVVVFQKMFDLLKSGGILVTYSCKGSVKRAMLEVGFQVEKIPGPPGKREMLRAFKN